MAFVATLVVLASGAGTGCHLDDPPEAGRSPAEHAGAAEILTSRPNIIVVMLDDLDVASFAQLLHKPEVLPNIHEHLVGAGVSFSESFVSNAVCCPSRVTFLTGQYSHNSGTQALGGTNGGYTSFVPRQNDALATWLQNAGYHTGHVGKYLNGYNKAASAIVPSGWNEWHALIDPSTYDMGTFEIRERYVNGGAGGPVVDGIHSYDGGVAGDGYQTDVLATHTQGIITRWRQHASHKPLFIAVMPSAPHVEVKPCWDRYLNHAGQFNLEIRPKGWNPAGMASLHYGRLRAHISEGKVNDFAPRNDHFQLPSLTSPAFDEEDISDKPGYLRDGYPTFLGSGWPRLASTTVCDVPFGTHVDCDSCAGGQMRLVSEVLQRQHLGRLESMLSVDDMVGTIVGTLSPAELDNTLFIFTSDNGYLLGEHRLVNKQQPYEESIRVPLVIRPPASSTVARGSSRSTMVVNTDLPATILDYADVQASPMRSLDGRSLKDILQGTTTSLSRRRLLVEHFFSRPSIVFWDVPDYFGVRTAASAGTAGAHSTYVEYYADGASWDGRITDREYYTLGSDPMQLASRHDDASTAEERLILSEHVAALRYCRGPTCTQAEDRPDFTSRQFLPVVTANSPDPGHPAFFHPGARHHSEIVIHNPSSTIADALLLIYGAVDDFSLAENLTLAPGESKVIQPFALGVPPGFVGSAAVASSVPLTVVVNTANKLSGDVGISGGNSAAQYVGIDASRTASKLQVPVVKKMLGGNKNTVVYVQNAGAVATDITARFVRPGDATTYERVFHGVAPRKVVAVRPQDVPGLPDGLSAATFTSHNGAPLAGVSWEYEVQATGAPISPAQRLQATNAFAETGAFRDAGTTIYFPVVKRRLGGRTTGHQVQNASSQSLQVQITYHRSARCPALANGPLSQQSPAELAPGESYTFYDWASLGDSCLTSATATAVNGSAESYLTGVASERCNDLTKCRDTLTTYSAIASHRATTTLVAPVFKEELGGKQTGLAVLNTSTTAAATVTASFRTAGAVYTCTKSIPALGLIAFHDMTNAAEWAGCWDQSALPASSLAAVTVTASEPIVGVVNEADLMGTQDDANYEAINR